ncbi:ap2-containing protein [Hordeum vulgare]|nr:ap2-containing protein [Hordeum vulgare]
MHYYLGTFDTADLAARAYDVAGWRLGVPQEDLNFPDITSLRDAIFINPLMKNWVKTRLVKKKEESARVIETDDEAMAWFAREHPEYM